VACAAGAACVGVAAFHIGVTERADVRIYEAFGELSDGDVYVVARNVTNVVEPERLVVLVALLLGAAALQRRWRLALGTLVVVVGANLTTQVLKPLTAAERIPSYLADASWPSGHMTAMTSLALCLVVVAPRVLSAAAAGVAAVMVVAMAYSLLLIGTHHPSDAGGDARGRRVDRARHRRAAVGGGPPAGGGRAGRRAPLATDRRAGRGSGRRGGGRRTAPAGRARCSSSSSSVPRSRRVRP